MFRILSIIILFSTLSVPAYAQQIYSRIRVSTPTHTDFKRLAGTGAPVDHVVYKKGAYVEMEVSSYDLNAIRSAGFEPEVLIEDVSDFYVRQNAKPEHRQMAAGCDEDLPAVIQPQNFSLGTMGGYFTYQEMLDNLDSMAAKYPSLISVKQPIGSFLTHENRPIYWVKISDNPNSNEPEPEVFYNSLHHAREAASLSQLIFYMWYLLENYQSNPEIASLINNLEMFFVPCINPDGYIYNQTNYPNGGGMWRKNRRNNGSGEYGVDLNRNYGYFWGFDNTGSSPNPASDTYRGPSAFSEPETQAIKYFCENHSFKLTLNYHTYGDLLIYPWGYQASIYTPDSAAFVDFAKLMTKDNNYMYGTGDQTVGYVTNGDSDDWMYGEQTSKNKIFSMTPEAGLSSDGFWPAVSRITDICKVNVTQNLSMAKLALRYASVKENSPSVFNQTNGFIRFNIQRLGLDSPATFNVSLSPLLNVSSTGPAKSFSSMNHLETRLDSISFVLDPFIDSGDLFSFVVSVDNGLWVETDTVVKQYGAGNVVYAHNGDQMSGWTSTNWNTTNSTFYSSPSSITDSPGGNYPNNVNRTITLSAPVDLTNAISASLSFFARWEIESGYDFVQVLASSNGINWTPLCGKYTKTGNSNQEDGEPLYDGDQNSWVEEQMSLNDFTGNNVFIRFRLRSDAWVNLDGFYFDDLKIESVEEDASEIESYQSEELTIMPNPASGYFYLSGMAEGTEVNLYNQLGQRVKTIKSTQSGQALNISGMSSGVYTLQAEGRTGRLVVVR